MQATGAAVPALETRPEAGPADLFHLRAALMLMSNNGRGFTFTLAELLTFAHVMELSADEAFELHDVLEVGLNELNEWREQRGKPKANGAGLRPANAGKGN